MTTAGLHADRAAIGDFVRCLFKYADAGTFCSLRAFDQFRRDVPPIFIRPVVLDDLETLIHHATMAAEDCAQSERPVVFAPPICTFSNPERARGADLANGLSLSVELDDVDPDVACARLVGLLGPPTLVVHSGSQWTNGSSVSKPKIHIHWRLSEPTRDQGEHDKLRQARGLAALLVGADPTGQPTVHPLRWPGSWNCKGTPRPCSIASQNPAAEIHLDDALAALEGAIEAAGWARAEMPRSSSEPEAPLMLVRDALSYIPNLGTAVHYNEWIRIGYALHRATGGGEDGFSLFDTWSRLSEKYHAGETEAAWRRIAAALAGKAPPRTVGAGTIFYLADQAGWQRPSPFSSLFGDRPGHRANGANGADPGGAEWGAQGAEPKAGRPDILHISEVVRLPPLEFLIKGLIPEGGLSVLYGPPKSGKTFVALSMGLHIAAGMSWAGLPVRQGGVVYIAGEGLGGMGTRLLAACAQYGIDLERPPFWVVTHALDFTRPGVADALVKLVRGATGDEPIAWVVIDTLARAMPGADENSAQEVGLVIAAADLVRFALRCTVTALHHAGKDASRGLRGTSALRGAVDATLRVEPEGKRVRLISEDQKDAEPAPPMLFDMVEVAVPGSIGRSSLVPVLAESEVAQERGEVKHNPASQIALDALLYVIGGADAGGVLPPGEGLPSHPVRGCRVKDWRKEHDIRRPELDSEESVRKSFNRSVDRLTRMGLIGRRNPWVWLTNETGNETGQR